MKYNPIWSLILCFPLMILGCDAENIEDQSTATMQQKSEEIPLSTPAEENDAVAKNDDSESDSTTPKRSLYQNSKLGFSFSYSGEYTFEETDNSVSIWINSDYDQIEDFVETTPLVLYIAENPQNLSLPEWINDGGYLIESEIRNQKVSGLDAVSFQWLGMWSYTSVVILLPDSNQFMVITLDNDMLEYQTIFEEILGTLEVF